MLIASLYCPFTKYFAASLYIEYAISDFSSAKTGVMCVKYNTKATKMIIMHIFMLLVVLGLGNNLSELKIRIQQIQDELSKLGQPDLALAEMINSTNILRLNEYLAKSDEKKTNLILAYGQYTQQLEQIISSLLSIQVDLRDIIKTEASIIETQESQTNKPKTRRKSQTKKSKN